MEALLAIDHFFLLRFEIFGVPKSDPEEQQLLYSNVAMTDPKTPTFEDSPVADTDSITIKGEKVPNSLQDYFLVEYSQLDGDSQHFDPLNVTDLPEQKKVELFIGNLNPGRTYNVSVKAFRRGVASRPWTAIITTSKSAYQDIHRQFGALYSGFNQTI